MSSLSLDNLNALRSGDLDLIEHIAGLCDRIEAQDPIFRVTVADTFDRNRVLEAAASLLKKHPDPTTRPPLFGLPVGVKDIFRVDGFPTRCGSSLPAELFAGPEATCVSRLKRAGALVLGKTVTTEFAYFEPGPTRNPHNIAHTPGGSSSGSAAGVASGFFALALGSQTVGSVIRPAAFCGVLGFKPSYGRIPTAGVLPFSATLDHVGIFCQDVAVIDRVMPVMTEGWQTSKDRDESPNIVLAVPQGPYLDQATVAERELFEQRLTELKQQGYQIKRVNTLEDIAQVNANHRRLMAAEKANVHSQWFHQYRHLYRPKTIELIEQGRTVSDEELQQCRRNCRQFRKNLELEMTSEGIDYWVCPPATDQAPKGLESTGNPVMNLPWTSAGLPAITLPTGVDQDGLPHGIQIVGRFMEDENLISHAKGMFNVLK